MPAPTSSAIAGSRPAALERLSFAAECRDNTMSDACRLIEVKAELASANQQARAAIGFDYAFNSIGLDSIDEHAALFIMGAEL